MNTIIIPLTKGYETIIDECDAHLDEFKWTVDVCLNTAYAYRQTTADGETKHLRLHNLILPPPPGLEIDHIDGDGLNNRRANLRACTHQQNLMNSPPRSGHKGVRMMAPRKGVRGPGFRAKPWQVRMGDQHIGYFATEIEAAHAYDEAAFAEFGEFAWLNRDHFEL